MADNTELNSGTGGDTIASDDIAGIKHQRVKVQHGADGSATDVSAASPMPVDQQSALPAGTNAIGKLAANSGVDIGDVDVTSIAAGDNNIGNVDIASALPAGTNEIGKLAAGVAEIGNVKNSGTFATQATLQAGIAEVGKLAAGVAEIGNVKNSGTFATQATLQAGIAEVGKLAAGVAEIGNVKNSGTFATQATLQAGTAEVGKLAAGVAEIGNVKNSGTFATQSTLQANSGVDIGDVDVTSISAGANLIGDVGISGARTSGGTSIARDIDLDNGTLTIVKASAGQLYWLHVMNLHTAVVYVKFYNAASGTLGTGTPVLTFAIPTQGDANGAGFTLAIPNGIAFATGITVGAGTGVADADNTDPGTNKVIFNCGFA